MGGVSGTGVMARASRPQGPAHVYQPTYGNYSSPINQSIYGVARGLGATPQYIPFQAQMPTFTRPQMAPPPSGGFGRISPEAIMSSQPAYRIPYGPSIPKPSLTSGFGGMFKLSPVSREQSLQNLAKDYRQGNLTEAAYNNLMQNPETSLDLIRRIEAGEDLTARTPPPIRYMTAGQQQAYNQKLASELESVIAPRTTFDTSNDPGSAGG